MRERFLKRLLRGYEAWYDVEQNYEFAGRRFAAYAEYHAHGEHYMLVKRAKLWEADVHQYLFFESCHRLDEEALEALVAYMKTQALSKVCPENNHMSSDLGLIIVADEIDDAANALLKRTRYKKNYSFGLRGWSDLKLVAVDMNKRHVVSNPAGKDMRQSIEKSLSFELEGAGV
ncbi:MAG: hypothetical protein IJ125_09215 [Atopobiaceae bacterium]|nr:hypothetical protein [Atopobiaceae bacterium]